MKRVPFEIAIYYRENYSLAFASFVTLSVRELIKFFEGNSLIMGRTGLFDEKCIKSNVLVYEFSFEFVSNDFRCQTNISYVYHILVPADSKNGNYKTYRDRKHLY